MVVRRPNISQKVKSYFVWTQKIVERFAESKLQSYGLQSRDAESQDAGRIFQSRSPGIRGVQFRDWDLKIVY